MTKGYFQRKQEIQDTLDWMFFNIVCKRDLNLFIEVRKKK